MIKVIKAGRPLCWDSNGDTVINWADTFNGTFSWNQPISIMVNNGQVIRGESCHYLWGFPESVLWIKKDGSKGLSRVKYISEIKGHKDIVFAIGGVGISNYDPEAEGFSTFTARNIYNHKMETKKFGDVLRNTKHSVFGFVGDKFFASIMEGAAEEIKAECEYQGFTHVIMGDGGSFASCNTKEYQLNMTKSQHSLVQVAEAENVELKEHVEETRKWRYFKYQEFANTKDGNANETKHELIDMLDEFRHLIGRSITVTSGFRTQRFNASVGGDPNSEHIYGLAADIKFNFNGYTKESITRIAKYLGVKNIGIYWVGGRIGGKIAWIHWGIRDNGTSKVKVMDWTDSGRLLAKTYI